ncbi:MAG: chemotaxis protein CheX [Campylobacteraceae bacterium]|nr:chemotaxis protein CheX [Campylobacteraceae bacterium]
MYQIENEIMIVNYVGHMKEQKTFMLVNTIASMKDRVQNRHVKGVVFSLRTAMYDLSELKVLVTRLSAVRTLQVPIAIVDYSAKTFQALKALTKNTPIKLFKTIQAAQLFFAPKTFKGDLSILVYDEDEDNVDDICKVLASQGYSVHRAKSEAEFKAGMEEGYDITITQCRLNLTSNKPTTAALSLSKKLIQNLPTFMDTAVETLVSFTGMEAKKTSHAVKPFTTKIGADVVTAMMNFKGDMEGRFVLIFPRKVAILALEAMLGEPIKENDNAAIMDGVGELCNIITGSTKTKLSKKEIKILFDLPKTFTAIGPLIANIGDENGIWIDMQLDGNPFYMFITK